MTTPVRSVSDVPRPPRGTWFQRFLIAMFSVLLGLLIYWLLGFVMSDLGSLPGPDYQALEERQLDAGLVQRSRSLQEQVVETQRSLENERTRQRLLRESTTSSQTTLNQMLDIQRVSLEQSSELTAEQRQAIAESQQLFLENQRRDQQLTESIVALSERLNELSEEQRQSNSDLETARVPIREQYQELWQQHNLRMAALKLACLAPLLLVATFLFARRRHGIWGPFVYAFGIAVLIKTFVVMHDHFPTRYFKYILIVSCLVAVVAILFYLLRSLVRPGRDVVLKQYRESYESFKCAICNFPIRRGPLKFAVWKRRSIGNAILSHEPSEDTAYTCPSCGTSLYEKCAECGQTRHALLPACEHCGATHTIAGVSSEIVGSVSGP